MTARVWAFPAGADSFSAATAIPANDSLGLATDLTGATLEVGEPNHTPDGSSTAGKSVWWSWVAPDTGYCTVDTLRTLGLATPLRFPTLAVYKGSDVTALTLIASSFEKTGTVLAPDALGQVKLTFYAVKGTEYKIALDSLGAVAPGFREAVLQVRHLALKAGTWMAPITMNETAGGVGLVTATMTSAGSVSGKFNYGGTSYSFAGRFSVDGYFVTSIPRKGPPSTLPIDLWIDGTGKGYVQASVGGTEVFFTTFYRRVVFDRLTTNSMVNAYTAALKHSSGTNPGGIGTIAFKIAANGSMRGSGVGPDGAPVTFSSALCDYTTGPLSYVMPTYVPLSKGKGALVMRIVVNETGIEDRVSFGEAIYIRPAASTSLPLFYPTGIYQMASIEGGTYTPPARGTRAMGFLDGSAGNGTMTLVASLSELLSDVTESLNLSVANKVTFTSLSYRPTLKLNAATGLVTGSITFPPEKPRVIKGMLIDTNFVPGIRGYVSGVTRTQEMKVEP